MNSAHQCCYSKVPSLPVVPVHEISCCRFLFCCSHPNEENLVPFMHEHAWMYESDLVLYPPKIGRISDVVRSGRGSEFVA